LAALDFCQHADGTAAHSHQVQPPPVVVSALQVFCVVYLAWQRSSTVEEMSVVAICDLTVSSGTAEAMAAAIAATKMVFIMLL